MKDTQKLIGTILEEPAERDAIHIAVAPVIAGQKLWPGAEIGFIYGSNETVMEKESIYGLKPLGVVDPFLKGPIEEGQRFYMFLYPGTVTTMKHYWEHPDFKNIQKPNNNTSAENEAETWLRKFADKWNFDYNEMINAALSEGGYVVAQGRDIHSRQELADGDEALFWQYVSVLTGRSFNEEHKENMGWSCTC